MSESAVGCPPRLLAISDDTAVLDLEGWLEELVEAGVDAVQIRQKLLPDPELFQLARRAVQAARGRLRVLINGRVDIALGAGADGVHLPSTSIPARALRTRWPELLIGLSTHRLEEIAEVAGVVDYVTFGPVYSTPSKAAYGPPQGLERLEAASRLGVPVLALGGLDGSRLEAVARAGAAGAAAIRALREPGSLVQMAARAALLWPSPTPDRG